MSVALAIHTSRPLLPHIARNVCFTGSDVGVGAHLVPSQWRIVPPDPDAQTSSLADPHTAASTWSGLRPVGTGHHEASSQEMGVVTHFGSDASQPPSIGTSTAASRLASAPPSGAIDDST